ncbi:hypothetical protein Lepto1489_22605 (plasmid) [Leptospira interrogans serovar Bataviae]|uniref:Uncharacterized protein n=1 Tax=Leptospira interrogans serovar Bataviae TaxID=312175 RepID=A0AAP9WQ95_LEPIR|nr:hypothetical protein [Leptospira interrogans serovar Ricardi]QOI53163.1 hypothetical protein Lepto1489_22605 [Leptospira interrogans serovar Bataviae]
MSFLGPFSNDEIQSNNNLKKLNVSRIELDFSSPLGTYNLCENLHANSIVLQTNVQIENAFDGNSSLTIGNSTDIRRYLEESGIDLNSEGIYIGYSIDFLRSVNQIRVYWNPGTSTKGQLSVILVYSDS